MVSVLVQVDDLFEYLATSGWVTKEQIADHFGIGMQTVQSHFSRHRNIAFKHNGKIKRLRKVSVREGKRNIYWFQVM